MVLLYSESWRVAGILEWIVSYLGAFWLLNFIGYVAYVNPRLCQTILTSRLSVPDEGIDIRERDPLLGENAYLN